MPTYEYNCKACGHTFEVQQSIKDNPLNHCNECGKDEVVRLISVSAFVLKGSQWCRDGYHSKVREELKKLPESKDDE